MRVQEISNLFDTLVSSYMRFKKFDDREVLDSIEFDEYEKSLYLTKAQEELVTRLYNGRNTLSESFEETEELRRYLADLVVEENLSPIVTSDGKLLGMESYSKFFTLPEDVWFITYEAVIITDGKCEGKTSMDVYPVKQDEYRRIRRNPFRGANGRRALRLDLADGVIEIVCKHTVETYYVRYLRKARPIILTDLPNNLSIEGVNTLSECELNEHLHRRIVEMAVSMALQSKGIATSRENREARTKGE